MFRYFMIIVLIIGLLISGCNTTTPQEQISIKIQGSDSEVNLVTRLAEEYMLKNPNIMISVTGGGSGVGIASLVDGNIDIANSSREMKQEEIDAAESNNDDTVFALRFATDGVAIIIHPDNPLSEITIDELGAIYRGEITNWQTLNGIDMPIAIYGRQSTSGTYVFFMEKVVKGEYSPEKRNLSGNSDIVEAIKNDNTGIGYVAIGYADDTNIKVINVAKDTNSQYYSPLVLENITSGNYALTRPLYQFIIGKSNQMILDFLQFEISDVGNSIVLDEGFYPISDSDKEFNKIIFE